MTPLPKRIQHVQEQYLQGVYEAKRGHEFDFCSTAAATDGYSRKRVMLQLTRDGARLQMLRLDHENQEDQQQEVLGSVALVDIQHISVCASPGFSFALQLRGSGSNQNDAEEELKGEPESGGRSIVEVGTMIFAVPNAAVMNQWVLTLTCGANAFQQQVQQQSQHSENAQEAAQRQSLMTTHLIWQAARLRIFELAHVLTLHEAIALVTQGVQRFLSKEDLQNLKDPGHPPMFLSSTRFSS